MKVKNGVTTIKKIVVNGSVPSEKQGQLADVGISLEILVNDTTEISGIEMLDLEEAMAAIHSASRTTDEKEKNVHELKLKRSFGLLSHSIMPRDCHQEDESLKAVRFVAETKYVTYRWVDGTFAIRYRADVKTLPLTDLARLTAMMDSQALTNTVDPQMSIPGTEAVPPKKRKGKAKAKKANPEPEGVTVH